ncbi:MAG: IPT/TIG domain-containing protein [Vicinamibacteria bacterium]|nr:IPT/TIG domain-containing protein [Vicinamibacteria bacterium]
MSHPSIVLMTGTEAGATLVLDEVLNNFAIGSDEGCNLVCTGVSVSPMHASVFLDDEGVVTVSDTNSAMGVFVNGARVMEQALSDGDEISLGPPGEPGSDSLRFAAHGNDAPLVDLSGAEDAPPSGLGGLEGLDAAPIEEPLFTSELTRPDFSAPVPPAFEEASSMEPLAPLDPLPDAGTSPVDEFPPLEPLGSSEPEPLPLPDFIPTPEPEPEPMPEFAPLPPSPPAPAPRPSAPKPPAPKAPAPRASAPKVSPATAARTTGPIGAPRKAGSDDADPLAGLAESLGGSSGGERFQPPPVAAPASAPAGPAKKKSGTPTKVMALRVGIIAVVLVSLAAFGLHRYSDSIVVPVIDKYLPDPAEPGQTVTINGSGFGEGTDPAAFKVTLGDAPVQVLDGSATRLNIMVPESLGAAGSQTLSLKVTAQGTTSTGRLLKIAVTPRIASLTPRVALSGDEVTIAGKWLGNAKTKPRVTVAGNEAEILDASPTGIRVRVPQVAATEGQKVSVRVAVGSDIGKEFPLNYGRLPFAESVSPARVQPGELITIAGLGLTGPDLSVRISGRSAVIIAASDTEIKASVPGLRLSESAGRRELVVQANEKSSIALPLEILRESSALYSPRFFAEGLEGGRVAVACDLGPVMVLGSDAASHRRAHEAAQKLNALIGQARTARVQFSASDVSIAGPGGPVLALTAADGSGNPRALAPVWAAVLTDMFDLFFQGRRPGRTVELSPEGRVFVDIFAAARRRSAEAGVGTSVLSSPDPSWSRALASLASAPPLGGGQALALLDGYWSGLIEVPGAIQPRKIEISLTATPSGLVGQRTSRQGRLSSDVSLEGLRYARRELRFSFVDGGENLSYVGLLDGDEIDGNVTKASGAKVGRLKFKLTR